MAPELVPCPLLPEIAESVTGAGTSKLAGNVNELKSAWNIKKLYIYCSLLWITKFDFKNYY